MSWSLLRPVRIARCTKKGKLFRTHDGGAPTVPAISGSAFDLIQLDVKTLETVRVGNWVINKMLTIIYGYTGWIEGMLLWTDDAIEVKVLFMKEWGY